MLPLQICKLKTDNFAFSSYNVEGKLLLGRLAECMLKFIMEILTLILALYPQSSVIVVIVVLKNGISVL